MSHKQGFFAQIALQFILLPLFFINFLSCKTGNDFSEPSLIFGHRGAGSGVHKGRFIENTLPSIQYALDLLDGVEIDVQMSKDGTIWLYHDNEIGFSCNRKPVPVCIPKTSDEEIEKIQICREGVQDRLYRLEEVMQELKKNNEKYLSLDVKGYFTENCFSNKNADEAYLREMAEKLVLLVEYHKLHENIIVETDYTVFLDQVKSLDNRIKCHLLGYNGFEQKMAKALKKNYNGISFNINDSSLSHAGINQAISQGLKIQLWTVSDSVSLRKARSFQSYSIQTDYFPEIN